MRAEESLKKGDLDAALAELQDAVREDPSNSKLRIFLFQLLAVRGEYDRAQKQLAVASDLDAETIAMVKTYEQAIACERFRGEVFAGKKTPLIFGEPEEWMALLLNALTAISAGKFEEAAEMRAKAFDLAPTTSGKANGEPFEWIADSDMRMGPMLELILNGKYQWVPFHRIQSIKLEPPSDLRDMVWTAAILRLATGGETVAFIPTRYVGAESDADDLIKLSRKTEWAEHPAETFLGRGQRILTTSGGEYSLLDLRDIELDVATITPTGSDDAENESDG